MPDVEITNEREMIAPNHGSSCAEAIMSITRVVLGAHRARDFRTIRLPPIGRNPETGNPLY